MSNAIQTDDTPQRSVSLTETERQKLKQLSVRYPIQSRRAKVIGVSRTSLLRIEQLGSGSEANIKILKQKLKAVKLENQAV